MDTIEKSILEKEKIDIHSYLHALARDPDEYVNKIGETMSLLTKHKAEEGDLLIFPADLPHQVLPNESDEDRIVISFNLWIQR